MIRIPGIPYIYGSFEKAGNSRVPKYKNKYVVGVVVYIYIYII